MTKKEKLQKFIKQQKKKTFKHAVILLPILIVIMFFLNVLHKPEIPVVEKEEDAVVTATFVGDIMLGRYVEHVMEQHGEEFIYKYVEPYFQISDYISGNFEHPVTTSDEYEKADKYIHLDAAPTTVNTLKKMNFNVLNLANNHTMDYGQDGLWDTLEAFSNADLNLVGAGSSLEDAMDRIAYTETNHLTIATLGFTDVYAEGFSANDYRGGVLPLDPTIFIPMIAEASEEADLVVVHAHWGQEYDDQPTTRQQEMAKAMADAGADIVIGHHPHVLQNIEVYNDTVIFYSLGNFVFDQGWTRTRSSAIVQYHLLEDGTGRFEVTPIYIREAQPRPLGTFSWLKKNLIFRQLTKGSQDLQWVEKSGKLVFDVDHSEKLKEIE